MGGGGGSDYTPVKFDELERRILERLQGVAKAANRVLFACEEVDHRALLSHMERSGLASDDKYHVAVGPGQAGLIEQLQATQVLVVFTDQTNDTAFVDALVEAAFASKIQGIHAKAHDAARVPSKILAYRLRSMSWDALVALLR